MGYRNISLLFLIILGTISSSERLSAQNSDLIFIGKDIGAAEMRMDQIIDYFKAKNAYWDNKRPVTVCLPGTKSEDAEKISAIIYKKSVRDVQKFWLSIVFQGRAKSPMFFESDQEMIDYVKKTPGAIGVLLNKARGDIPNQLIIKIRN